MASRPSSPSARALPALVALLSAGCGASEPLPENPSDDDEPPRVAIALRAEEAPADEETDTPQTRVVLVRIRHDVGETETTDLGTYAGPCMHASVPAHVVVRLRCWWAGAGAVVSVSRHGDELVAERSVVDEMQGAGDSETITTVELPEDAVLEPIRPPTAPSH